VGRRWELLTKHALVLLYVARKPDATLREISAAVGITERSVHRLVDDLVEDGYLSRVREGRRNRYQVAGFQALRHPLSNEAQVKDLLELLAAGASDRDRLDPTTGNT
jgi:DNA-binding MarR family transcriptional regulator